MNNQSSIHTFQACAMETPMLAIRAILSSFTDLSPAIFLTSSLSSILRMLTSTASTTLDSETPVLPFTQVQSDNHHSPFNSLPSHTLNSNMVKDHITNSLY